VVDYFFNYTLKTKNLWRKREIFRFVITFPQVEGPPVFTLNTTKKLGQWLLIYIVFEIFFDILIIF